VPDITFALNATLDAYDSLGIKADVEQFAARHWTLPKQPLKALDALILGVGTPAHSLSDLAEGLDWGKNRFGPLLGEVDPFAWVRLLRRPMRRKLRKVLERYHGPWVSAATRSRYRITFVWDITTLLKVGEMLGLSDLFYSGMLKRPSHSIEVVLLYATPAYAGAEKISSVCRWIFGSENQTPKVQATPAKPHWNWRARCWKTYTAACGHTAFPSRVTSW